MPTAAHDTVVQALEENLWELWSHFGRGDGCSLHEQEDALWFDTPIPTLPYNTVLRFQADRGSEKRIDAIFGHYRRRGVPFMWIVHPSARPLDLADRLLGRGMEEVEVCPGMGMDLAKLPDEENVPEGINVSQVTGDDDVRDMLDLVAWRWEVPDEVMSLLPGVLRAVHFSSPGSRARVWIARRNGVPVSKVGLYLAAGAAGIYGVATKPEARGLGLARNLTLRALHEARRDGYKLGILHSTPMARSMYEKMGFRAYATFRVFAPPNALHL